MIFNNYIYTGEKMKFLALALVLTSYNTFANTALENHLSSGYIVGETLEVRESGETRRSGEYVCDYNRYEEHTLLSKKNGVFTFYVKEIENRFCNEEVEEMLLITTISSYHNGFNNFLKSITDAGLTLDFDQDSKVITLSAEGKHFKYDLTDVDTFEAFNAFLTDSGRSQSGDMVTTHGKADFRKILRPSLPSYSDDIRICDTRLDSDPTDDRVDMQEICSK